MSEQHPLSKIVASMSVDCKILKNAVSVDSDAGAVIKISFDNFDESHLDDLDLDVLKDSLKETIETAKCIKTSGSIRSVCLDFDINLKIKAVLISGDVIEYNDDFFSDNPDDINKAINEIEYAEFLMSDTINGMQRKINEIKAILEIVPNKGDTSNDCQKSLISNHVNSLEFATNGISLLDFLENWEQL